MMKSEPKLMNWSFERRFMRKIAIDLNDCWIWNGCKMGNGYGQLGVAGKRWAAHRYAYTQIVGPITEGLDLDHLCRNRACCNPQHLEPVTRSVNLARGDRWGGKHNLAKTSCPNGHPYSGTNLYVHPTGRRLCRQCANKRASDARNRRRIHG